MWRVCERQRLWRLQELETKWKFNDWAPNLGERQTIMRIEQEREIRVAVDIRVSNIVWYELSEIRDPIVRQTGRNDLELLKDSEYVIRREIDTFIDGRHYDPSCSCSCTSPHFFIHGEPIPTFPSHLTCHQWSGCIMNVTLISTDLEHYRLPETTFLTTGLSWLPHSNHLGLSLALTHQQLLLFRRDGNTSMENPRSDGHRERGKEKGTWKWKEHKRTLQHGPRHWL